MKKKIIAFLSHRFTPLVLAVALCTTVGVSRYEVSKAAAEEAIAAEAFELVPLTWDMFATIMTALGVGTATYWAGKSVADRKLTLDEITERLVPEVGWFHQEVADFRDHDIPEYIEGVGGWIKATVADGKTWFSENVLGAFASFAADKGWLYTDPTISMPSEPVSTSTITSSMFYDSISSFEFLCDCYFQYSKTDQTSFACRNMLSFMKSNPSLFFNHYCYFTLGANHVVFYTAPISALTALSISRYGHFSGSYNQYYYRLSQSFDYIRYDASGTTTEVTSRNGTESNIYSGSVLVASRVEIPVSNLGLTGLAGTDVPVGEKGQVVDNDGAIDYPWPVPYPVDVAGSPSFPVTVPDVLAPDVVVLDPDAVLPGNPPIAVDDALSLPGAIDRDLPTDTTQEDAQAGDTDIPEDMPTESPIQPKDYNSFLLPSWIKNKFPFCIPFDLASVGKQFSESGAEAPVFKYTLRFDIDGGRDHDIVIDMSRFDPVMEVVRMGEFVLFMVGLLFATRKLLRG